MACLSKLGKMVWLVKLLLHNPGTLSSMPGAYGGVVGICDPRTPKAAWEAETGQLSRSLSHAHLETEKQRLEEL